MSIIVAYDLTVTFLLRHPSCYSCIRVNTLKSSTDAVMHKLMDIVSENGLSIGINGLDIGEQNSGSNTHEGNSMVHKCPYTGLENVIFVRGSGPHVLQYDNQPNQSVKEVIVSRKCAESVLRGAQVYLSFLDLCIYV
jgi:methyltransferase NSUN6